MSVGTAHGERLRGEKVEKLAATSDFAVSLAAMKRRRALSEDLGKANLAAHTPACITAKDGDFPARVDVSSDPVAITGKPRLPTCDARCRSNVAR